MVLHEGTEEILAATHHHLFASAGQPDCFYIGFRCRTVHLYALLGTFAGQSVQGVMVFAVRPDTTELRQNIKQGTECPEYHVRQQGDCVAMVSRYPLDGSDFRAIGYAFDSNPTRASL